MRRFTTGTTDQYIYFVAVDSTDLKTRETGLSSFTVYRARNGAAAAAYTTPTIAEVSSANMPGVYSLLLDEDMTIGSGNNSEEVVLHITQASMAPVTVVFELYRPTATEGGTLTISGGIAQANVAQWTGTAVAAVDTAGYPKVTIKSGTGTGELNMAAGRVSADVSRWAGTIVATPATAGVPAVEVIDISAAGQTALRAAVGLASADLDTQLGAIPTAAEINAEVVDALATDTYAEPGQGAPASTTSLAAKINYVYKAFRNKVTQTSTTFSLYADDATTVDQKATVSDDGTTFTRDEISSGP